MIVFTSDHGDYLGDHWMGEKELFHEQSARVPLIIYDPSPEAEATRGSVCTKFVEAIDLLPTFLDSVGAPIPSHRLEGRSILPLLHGGDIPEWRDAVFSEIDYAFYQARQILDVGASDARGYMIRTDRWKYIHFKNYPPQLFDLAQDPDEFIDLGSSPDHVSVRAEMKERLFERLLDRRNRVTLSDAEVQVFDALWADADASVDALIEVKGLKQMQDSGALEAIVDEVLAANARSVQEFRAGKDKAFNALVGQVMKASRGKANPALASELLKRKLG
jgi:arylsulfatase A-like enzyme